MPRHEDATPSPSPGERWSLVSGIAVTVLLLAAGAVAPDPPSHGGTDAAMLAHYRAHAPGILTGVYLWGLAMVALLLFAVALVRAAGRADRLAGREGGMLPAYTLVIATVAVAMLLVSQACLGAAAILSDRTDLGTTIRVIDEISHMVAHVAMLPTGVFVLAAGLTAWHARIGARWVAGFGAVSGAALAATASWVFVGGQALHDAGVFALLAFLLWTPAQGVALLRAGTR